MPSSSLRTEISLGLTSHFLTFNSAYHCLSHLFSCHFDKHILISFIYNILTLESRFNMPPGGLTERQTNTL